MLLYHCFPRTRQCSCPSCRDSRNSPDLGPWQLRSMMEHGLLLTPEHLYIPPNPRAEPGESPRTTFSQTRACFTLADRDQLWSDRRFLADGRWQSHSEIFGEFAVGLTSEAGRRIGAVPVMYFYPGDGNSADRLNMTHEALFLLRELRSLAIALAWLEAKAPSTQGDDRVWKADRLVALRHVLEGEEQTRGRIATATPRDAEKVALLLETRRPAACNLVERMDILLGFFQSTDAPESQSGHEHRYYEQREWRIGHAFGPHVNGSWLAQDRADDQSAVYFGRYLRSRDPCFFTDDRLRSSAILRGLAQPDELNRRSFFDFVSEVVCPIPAEGRVAALLEPVGFRRRAPSRPGPADTSQNGNNDALVAFSREELRNGTV